MAAELAFFSAQANFSPNKTKLRVELFFDGVSLTYFESLSLHMNKTWIHVCICIQFMVPQAVKLFTRILVFPI